MLIRVYRDGRVEGEYYCRLAEAEQELLKEYIPRKEKEEEAQRKKFRKWQKKNGEMSSKKKKPVRLIKEKNKYTPEGKEELIKKIKKLRNQGFNWSQIAKKLGISRTTAQRWYKETA